MMMRPALPLKSLPPEIDINFSRHIRNGNLADSMFRTSASGRSGATIFNYNIFHMIPCFVLSVLTSSFAPALFTHRNKSKNPHHIFKYFTSKQVARIIIKHFVVLASVAAGSLSTQHGSAIDHVSWLTAGRCSIMEWLSDCANKDMSQFSLTITSVILYLLKSAE
jgi:hypothetical protein